MKETRNYTLMDPSQTLDISLLVSFISRLLEIALFCIVSVGGDSGAGADVGMKTNEYFVPTKMTIEEGKLLLIHMNLDLRAEVVQMDTLRDYLCADAVSVGAFRILQMKIQVS